jgi:hypothetical protein
MKPRNDNPALYRENVYKSWKLMAYVASNISEECFVVHLEPNPGVQYDCLSLITRDTNSGLRAHFMLNRNGMNADVLERVWERFDEDGVEIVAKKLMAASGLSKNMPSRKSLTAQLCDDVVAWIEQHRSEEFCVGPIGWPGGCRTFLELAREKLDESTWPITDHGPEVVLGINGAERIRLIHSSTIMTSVQSGSNLPFDREEEIDLALRISSCSNFLDVLDGKMNACVNVVNWQVDAHIEKPVRVEMRRSTFHRPEPWAGNLSSAPIMFLSSNPSFDPRENFPTLDWDDKDAEDFFVNRFSERTDRGYGAIDGPKVASQDRAILKKENIPALTGRVKTWYTLRSRAAALLEKSVDDTRAANDYVMSEVVHCKSRKEEGVFEALPACVSKWFLPLLEASSAKLVVVSGEPAGRAVKQAIAQVTPTGDGLPRTWGSWRGKDPALGRWPKSGPELDEWIATGTWNKSAQDEHICTVKIPFGATERQFTFMWMPHPVRSVPQKIEDKRLYDSETLERLRSIVRN